MASNIFNQANGTSLASVDAKWIGDTSALEVQSSVLQITNASTFNDRYVAYSNGQLNSQQSEVTLKAGCNFAGGEVLEATVQYQSSSVLYSARVDNTNLTLRRNGVFQSQAAHGMTLASAGNKVKITYDYATGVVNAYANGALITTFTDGTRLTGGLPGFFINVQGTVSAIGLTEWTDNVGIRAALVGTRGVGLGNTATTSGGTTAASGSTFAFFVSYDATAGAITTAGDNKGNTYTPIGTPQTDAGAGSAGLGRWYVCENGVGGASHTATFTTTNACYPVIHLIEIRGATLTPLDQIAQGYDATTPFALTTPTLSQADELVLFGCAQNIGSTDPYLTSDSTLLSQEPDTAQYWTSAVSALVVASTAPVSASFTRATATISAGLALVTFRAAAAAANSIYLPWSMRC